MHLSSLHLSTTGALICALALTATPSAAGRRFAHVTDANAPLAYISDSRSNLVAIFDRDGTKVGTIARELNSPQGLFVDARHNLWVANGGAGNVLKFPRGAVSPTERLADAGAQPYDVTICPDGTVYVGNAGANFSGGDIAVYARGKRSPSGTLTYAGASVFYVTCDASGNVFAAILFGTTSVVAEFPGGQQTGATLLPIGSGGNPGGIKADGSGNLLYNDESGSVTEYTESGAPTGRAIAVPGDWTDIALDRESNAVLGAEYTKQIGQAYAFPGGRLRQAYRNSDFSFPTGTAFDPGTLGRAASYGASAGVFPRGALPSASALTL